MRVRGDKLLRRPIPLDSTWPLSLEDEYRLESTLPGLKGR